MEMAALVGDGEISIQHAKLSDSADLAKLLGELGYPTTADSVKGTMKRLYRKKKDRIFVAVHEGRVVGFASCHIMPLIHRKGDLCRVTALIIAEECRRRKIGTLLMNTVERYARSNECSRVEVTSGEHRIGAHQFYANLGYQQVSRRFIKVLVAKRKRS
jgi:GNAT superfamily N-acetyltransferase